MVYSLMHNTKALYFVQRIEIHCFYVTQYVMCMCHIWHVKLNVCDDIVDLTKNTMTHLSA